MTNQSPQNEVEVIKTLTKTHCGEETYEALKSQGLFGDLDDFWLTSYARYFKLDTLIKSFNLIKSIDDLHNLDKTLADDRRKQNDDLRSVRRKLHEITAANLNNSKLFELQGIIYNKITKENSLVIDLANELDERIKLWTRKNNTSKH